MTHGGARETRAGRKLWPTGTAREHEIVAVARAPEARSHIVAVFREITQVRFLPSLTALETSYESDIPLLGLLYLDGQAEQADADTWTLGVTRFCDRWQAIPVVGYAPLSSAAMRQCVLAGQAGVSTLVIRGVEDPIHVLGPVLERRSAQPLIRDIIAEVLDARERPSDDALRILRYCLEHVRDHLTVRGLAAGIGVSARTVATYLASARFPSPERLIMCARLLVAAWLLRDRRCSVNRAALTLGVEAAALRHLAARYLGHGAEELRGPRGIAHVVGAMQAHLRPPITLLTVGSETPLRAESLPGPSDPPHPY